jgi:hypothetical protein
MMSSPTSRRPRLRKPHSRSLGPGRAEDPASAAARMVGAARSQPAGTCAPAGSLFRALWQPVVAFQWRLAPGHVEIVGSTALMPMLAAKSAGAAMTWLLSSRLQSRRRSGLHGDGAPVRVGNSSQPAASRFSWYPQFVRSTRRQVVEIVRGGVIRGRGDVRAQDAGPVRAELDLPNTCAGTASDGFPQLPRSSPATTSARRAGAMVRDDPTAGRAALDR